MWYCPVTAGAMGTSPELFRGRGHNVVEAWSPHRGMARRRGKGTYAGLVAAMTMRMPFFFSFDRKSSVLVDPAVDRRIQSPGPPCIVKLIQDDVCQRRYMEGVRIWAWCGNGCPLWPTPTRLLYYGSWRLHAVTVSHLTDFACCSVSTIGIDVDDGLISWGQRHNLLCSYSV
jgi:hypothetical protein